MTDPQLITVYGDVSTSPTVVNEYAAMSIPAFWSGVRFLTGQLAKLPKRVNRRIGEIRQHVEHPVNKLLTRKINQYQIPFTFWETLYHHAIVFGNGYAWIKRDDGGRPTALYNLNPECVTPFRHEEQQWYFIRPKGGKGEIVPAADIIHIVGLGFDGMIGYPVVYILAEMLEHARNAQKFGAKYLKKGTQVQGSVEIPAAATKEQIEQVYELIRRRHSGVDSDYGHIVLSGGATLKNGTIPPHQSQLLETLQFTQLQVCQALRVGPQNIYDYGRATWGNAEFMGTQTVKHDLSDWIEKSEEELTGKLLTEAEQDGGLYVFYNVDALLRGDSVTRTDNIIKEINAGLRSVNEGRALLDMPPDPDPTSDKLRVPVSFPVPGETDQPATAPPQREENAKPADSKRETLAAFMPLLDAACDRVETKTEKAFSNKAGKPKEELTVWGNVFAQEQESYTHEALQPVAKALADLTGITLNVAQIGEKYAAAIRRRLADGTQRTLAQIIEEVLHGHA